VINIGGDEHKTLNDWYKLVNEVTGYGKDAIHLDPRPGEVLYAYCEHSKAEKLTGFKNTIKVKDAISEMWEYFKKVGPRPFTYINNFEINSPQIPITWRKKLF
jgi:nucleoside-diphosphate-sugar epimerase